MNIQETKQLISESKNICLIPAQEPQAICSALALFYTLRELGKNVNLILDPSQDSLPENLKFLSPSLDFISQPKNFVISIPSKVANVSQIYYEKNDEALKVHLTIENGLIKKDNLAFYFAEPKPDAVLTIGIKDYMSHLKEKLDPFGYLLEAPVINIDSSVEPVQENKNFGKINIIESASLAQIAYSIRKGLSEEPIKAENAACLLAALVLHTDNFKKNITADVFEVAGVLMKAGADLKQIVGSLKI